MKTKGPSNFIVLLQVLFIGLKITGLISWSWPLVLIPFFIYLVLSFIANFIL